MSNIPITEMSDEDQVKAVIEELPSLKPFLIKSALDRRRRLKNNRKETRCRRVQLIAAYSAEDISKAPTSIEKLRRARSLKNIQHHA